MTPAPSYGKYVIPTEPSRRCKWNTLRGSKESQMVRMNSVQAWRGTSIITSGSMSVVLPSRFVFFAKLTL